MSVIAVSPSAVSYTASVRAEYGVSVALEGVEVVAKLLLGISRALMSLDPLVAPVSVVPPALEVSATPGVIVAGVFVPPCVSLPSN
jgi:hypothetical protein